MRLRGRCWFCAVVAVCALVSSAYGQVGGAADKQTSAVDEQAVRELLAQEAAQKEALAEWIVAREEMQSGREFDAAYRSRAKQALITLSIPVLEAQKLQEGLGTNALGDSQADLVYTPVTPCRLIDTRLAGGTLSPGVPRSFKVTGDTTSQGGANCGIPVGPATSAMVNFVAVNPAGRGNMQITPFGQALPLASIINYSNTAGTALANGLAVALCNPAAATCTNDVTIQANVSAVDLVADVQGYFRRVSKDQILQHWVTRTSATTVVGTACTNYSGGSITVTAPVAGKITVRANVDIRLNQVNGTFSEVDVGIGTTSTDCSFSFGYAEFAFLPAAAPTGSYHQWLHPSLEIPVAPGTYTYYLNARALGSTGSSFFWGALEATFIANP